MPFNGRGRQKFVHYKRRAIMEYPRFIDVSSIDLVLNCMLELASFKEEQRPDRSKFKLHQIQ